jgi:glutamyl-tRNA synthetase
MAAEFDLTRINKNAARFDVRKLEAINGDKIRNLDPADFVQRITPFLQGAGLIGDPVNDIEAAAIRAAAPLIQGRISKLTEAPGMIAFLLTDDAKFVIDPDDDSRFIGPNSAFVISAAYDALAGVNSWRAEDIRNSLHAALVDGLGLKPKAAFGGALRVAVTGRRVGPPLFESIELLGRERTPARLAQASRAIPLC